MHLERSGAMLADMRNPLRLLKDNKPRKELMDQMGAAYATHGVISLARSGLYTSVADADEVIDDAIVRFGQVFAQVAGV